MEEWDIIYIKRNKYKGQKGQISKHIGILESWFISINSFMTHEQIIFLPVVKSRNMFPPANPQVLMY